MPETSELDNLRKVLSSNVTTAFQSFQDIESQLSYLDEQLEQLYQKKPELSKEISALQGLLNDTIERVSHELAYFEKIRNEMQELENSRKSGEKAFGIFLENVFDPTEEDPD